MTYKTPEKLSDLLKLIQKLLDAGKPHDAIELIRHSGVGGPELINAHGVALLRAGELAKAIELYRGLCVSAGGVSLKSEVPTLYKVNYATALLLTGNTAGCLAVLKELGDRPPTGAVRLRSAIVRWKQSLTWVQRTWFALTGDAPRDKPIVFDDPPGELSEASQTRPAA